MGDEHERQRVPLSERCVWSWDTETIRFICGRCNEAFIALGTEKYIPLDRTAAERRCPAKTEQPHEHWKKVNDNTWECRHCGKIIYHIGVPKVPCTEMPERSESKVRRCIEPFTCPLNKIEPLNGPLHTEFLRIGSKLNELILAFNELCESKASGA